ncbi:MAG: M23 family metallopeptidase [Clostridia bacterium]|nr:M23 family metallopeptidase [Clostridia bacterium]
MNFMYPLGAYLTITQGFHSNHLGMDFGWNGAVAGSKTQPIVTAEAGTVVDRADGWGNTYPNNRAYGNFVIISHDSGWYSVYAHLDKGSVAVKVGDKVQKGQQIGRMGDTGYSRGNHLHFELRKGANSRNNAINPIGYLSVQNNAIISDSSKFRSEIKVGVPLGNVGTPVGRDKQKRQVEVTTLSLRARKRPELNDAVILGYITKGAYNILDERDMRHEASNGYIWYMVEENVWAAFSGDWAIVHEVEENAECAEVEALAKEYEAKWKEAATEADAAKVYADTLLTIISEAEAVLRKAD